MLYNFIQLDKQLRKLQNELDNLNAQRNKISKQIPKIQNLEEKKQLINEVQNLKEKIENLEKQYNEIKKQHRNIWIQIPNPAAKDVPIGEDENDNKIIAEYKFEKNDEISQKIYQNYLKAFQNLKINPTKNPKPHWEILENRSLIDPKR